MFGRATITLVIGPHSSLLQCFCSWTVNEILLTDDMIIVSVYMSAKQII